MPTHSCRDCGGKVKKVPGTLKVPGTSKEGSIGLPRRLNSEKAQRAPLCSRMMPLWTVCSGLLGAPFRGHHPSYERWETHLRIEPGAQFGRVTV